MRIAIYVSLIILSLTIFVIGAFINNIAIIVLGGVIGLGIMLYLYLNTEGEAREKFYLPKDKYEPVLSEELKERWKHKMKK
jgi:hypothetical protein